MFSEWNIILANDLHTQIYKILHWVLSFTLVRWATSLAETDRFMVENIGQLVTTVISQLITIF